jgi:hypothetical protein
VIRNALAAKVVTLGIAAYGVAHDPGCGSVDSTSSGVNAPCTRDKDCRGDLVCEKGVCTTGDAGAGDAAPGDAAHDG